MPWAWFCPSSSTVDSVYILLGGTSRLSIWLPFVVYLLFSVSSSQSWSWVPHRVTWPSDYPLDKDDTWEPVNSLTGSEHMICEFQRSVHTAYILLQSRITQLKLQMYREVKEVEDKRKIFHEKNTSTTLDNRVDVIQKTKVGPYDQPVPFCASIQEHVWTSWSVTSHG